MLFIIRKINLILGISSAVFLASYVLFSGLSTSLDFNIEKALARQTEAAEEYEQLLANTTEAQGRVFLAEAGADLGLVETTLANGYIDIRPEVVSVGDTLVRNQ